MSEKTFMAKEEARMNLEDCIGLYREAAEIDDMDRQDMANEIADACFDAGIKVDVIPA